MTKEFASLAGITSTDIHIDRCRRYLEPGGFLAMEGKIEINLGIFDIIGNTRVNMIGVVRD